MDKQTRYNIILKEDLIFKSIHEHYEDNDNLLKKINTVMGLDSFHQDNVIWLHKNNRANDLLIANPFSK